MTSREKTKEERLAEALRQNLKRRKAQAREFLPGTGRGTGEAGGGAGNGGIDPSVSADALPPPRSRED